MSYYEKLKMTAGKDEGSFTFSKEGLGLGDTFEMKDVGKVSISRIEKAGELEKME